MKTYTFDLSDKKLKIKSVVIKETTGIDEDQAINAANAKKSPGLYLSELVRASIVEMDGKPAEYPFLAYDRLNKKTTEHLGALYNRINGLHPLGSELVNEALTPALEADDTFTFDWSKIPGAAFRTITIKEVTGADQVNAGMKAANKKKNAEITTTQEELVSASIVRINGSQVKGTDVVAFNSRTRNLLHSAFNIVNTPEYEDSFNSPLGELPTSEVTSFLEHGETASTHPSSALIAISQDQSPSALKSIRSSRKPNATHTNAR